MKLDELDTFQLYLAIRLHFTSDSYDFFVSKGRVKNTKFETLLGKSYYPVIRKMSSTMTATEIRDYCIANMLVENGAHLFDIESTGKRIWQAYKKRKAARPYYFEKDVRTLCGEMSRLGAKSFSDAFRITPSNEYPFLLLMYLGGHISIDTFSILLSLNTCDYLSEWSSAISDQFVFPEVKRQVMKVAPFVKVSDSSIFLNILDRVSKEFFNGQVA